MIDISGLGKSVNRNLSDEVTKSRINHKFDGNGDAYFSTYNVKSPGSTTVLVFIHGAGHSYASWITLLSSMINKNECGVELPEIILVDLPGHGNSSAMTSDEQWSKSYLLKALINVLNLHNDSQSVGKEYILVGHSLGGALVIHLLTETSLKVNLGGCIVLDCVEGVALQNLHRMEQFVARQKEEFVDVSEAIRWCLGEGGILKSEKSAGNSVPTQLVKTENGSYVWKADLKKSIPYWRDWFLGCSDSFVSHPSPFKVLVVAGSHEMLDSKLIIGHMQGKFQVQFLQEVGHLIHEDAPEEISSIIISLLERKERMKKLNMSLNASSPK